MSWGATASWVLCLACFLCWPRSYTCVGGGPLGPRRAVRPSVPLSKKGGPTGSLFFFLTLYTAVMSFEILFPFGLWVSEPGWLLGASSTGAQSRTGMYRQAHTHRGSKVRGVVRQRAGEGARARLFSSAPWVPDVPGLYTVQVQSWGHPMGRLKSGLLGPSLCCLFNLRQLSN